MIAIPVEELRTKIGDKLNHGLFIEEVIILNYRYIRRFGIDYCDMLANQFLKLSYNLTKDEVDINNFVSEDVLINRTYTVLDKLDIILLGLVKDLKFKDIIFKAKGNNKYIFSVSY